MISTATCQYCGWNGTADRCGPLKNAWERIAPGDVMPAGECPECNASAMLDEDRPEPCVRIETTPDSERATHFGVRSTARALADVMATAAGTWSYRVQDIDHHGFRVAVYPQTPYPPMLPDGYLRIVPASHRGRETCT